MTAGGDESPSKLSFTGRWDFVVHDESAFLEFVRERVRRVHGEDAANDPEHLGDVNSALETLLSLALVPPGLEPAGAGWDVEWVEKTLFEMSDEERDATGF